MAYAVAMRDEEDVDPALSSSTVGSTPMVGPVEYRSNTCGRFLNPGSAGTIPTLVVPTMETTGPEVTTKYRSLRDTMVGRAQPVF